MVLEKTLESPLDSKEIKPVSSKEINPEYLEGLMLKLKLQYLGHFPHSSVSKESACNAGDPGSIPGLGKSSGEGNGNPLWYFAWRIPWTEEPGRLQFMGSQESGTT